MAEEWPAHNSMRFLPNLSLESKSTGIPRQLFKNMVHHVWLIFRST